MTTNCRQAPGAFFPVIDRNRCEGKGPCVTACPYQVLELFVLPAAERSRLSFKGRIKGFVHGWGQATVARPELCMACGACVAACPEQAVSIVRAKP